MSKINNYSPVSAFIPVFTLSVFCIVAASAVFYSQQVIAEEAQVTHQDSTGETTANTTDSKKQAARPVEIGVGGVIEPERKYRTRAESLFKWHAHLLWESRYVTEGRDNLDGNHLASVSSEFSIGEIYFVPWYAYSAGADFSELDLNFFYGAQLTDKLTAYVGFNRIYAQVGDHRGNDSEINFDLSYLWLKKIHIYSTLYHSFKAEGSFMEVAFKTGQRVGKKTLFGAQFLLGANADYVPESHNGLNHFQLRANIAYQPRVQIELYAYIAYNQAINRDPEQYPGDVLLDDFVWGGAGFSYGF